MDKIHLSITDNLSYSSAYLVASNCVDVGIQHIERIGVPQRAHEACAGLPSTAFVVKSGWAAKARSWCKNTSEWRPRRTSPAHPMDSTALPLDLHIFWPFSSCTSPSDNDIFIRRFVENQRGDGQQRIEPASGLIDGFRNKIGRKLLFKQLLVFKRDSGTVQTAWSRNRTSSR